MTNLASRKFAGGRNVFRRTLAFFLVASFVLLAPGLSRGDSPSVSTATPEGRLAVFDDVWQTVNDRYYDKNFHGVDWWAQRARFRDQAAAARDQVELYSVLRSLVTSLKDAHTRVFAPEEKFDWQRPRFITVGISLREIEGRLTVVNVERGSDAERAGIRAGDLLESIDGEPAINRLETRLRAQPDSSTPQAARLFALSSLMNGPSGSTVNIDWKDSQERLHETALTRRWYQRTPGLRIGYKNNIAVISIDAFTHAIALDFARNFSSQPTRLQKARGIVIDLRGNGGGDAQAMAEIVAAFLPPATALGQFTDRHGYVSLKIDTGAGPFYSARINRSLNAPIIILASERTSSAAEIFISSLQKTNRAVVLGTHTCGCVLAVRMHHALPDGGELAISEMDFRTADGERLEGEGIQPDTTVNQTRQMIYAGRDQVLEAAVSRLRRNAHH
jgi:carboxyl-terminal processing protease